VRKLIATTVHPDLEDDEDLTSRTDARTERRRSEEAWAEFAKTLVTMSERHLLRMELGEELLRVVQDTRRITSAGAKNRGLRLVRTQLRGLDLQKLRERLEDLSHPSTRRRTTPVDDWRARLLQGSEPELAAFLAEHPRVDRQRLRTLLRNAKKAAADVEKKALLALNQALREALAGA
jgi:ribosome-associated protein